jgi:hypothetical protein
VISHTTKQLQADREFLTCASEPVLYQPTRFFGQKRCALSEAVCKWLPLCGLSAETCIEMTADHAKYADGGKSTPAPERKHDILIPAVARRVL